MSLYPSSLDGALAYLNRHYPDGGAPIDLIDHITRLTDDYLTVMARLCRAITGDPTCCDDLPR